MPLGKLSPPVPMTITTFPDLVLDMVPQLSYPYMLLEVLSSVCMNMLASHTISLVLVSAAFSSVSAFYLRNPVCRDVMKLLQAIVFRWLDCCSVLYAGLLQSQLQHFQWIQC